MLPVSLKFQLQKHLENVRRIHEVDSKDGFGSVLLPSAFAKKYSNAGKMWAWQWVFPQACQWRNKETCEQVGIILILRLFSAPCMKPFYGLVFRSQSAVTCYVTHLQRIYWKQVTISVPYKSFSVIAMFQPLWFTPTSSIAAVSAFKALSTECNLSLYHLVKIGLICQLFIYTNNIMVEKLNFLFCIILGVMYHVKI